MQKLGILGRKLGMTQIFDEEGRRIPVTVIEAGPNVVLDIRTPDRHGYAALQLGFADQKEHRVNKPDMGRFKKAGVTPKRYVKEIRIDPEAIENFKVGQELKVDEIFSKGDPVDVTGTSKGKGFQGVMKRYGFAGFRATHGTHEYFRHGGSIGNRLTPGRVIKGKRMSGHMGSKRVTVQNLKVVDVRPEHNLLLVSGSVPGPKNGYVMIRFAVKKRFPEKF